jgi:hypothetical protein
MLSPPLELALVGQGVMGLWMACLVRQSAQQEDRFVTNAP